MSSVQIQISNHNFEPTRNLSSYINKKLKGLKKFIPKGHRDDTTINVSLKREPSTDEPFLCDIIIHTYPKKEFVIKERAVNMFAAIDICQAKLTRQLRKHKETLQDESRSDTKKTLRKVRQMVDKDFFGKQN
jgi:ribosomal subunit interface protein